MGYSIQYDRGKSWKYPMRPSKNVKTHRIIPIVLVLVFLAGFISMGGLDVLKDWILPGDADVTEAALSGLINDIRAGESVKDAVTVFCLGILENAQVQ